MPEPQPTRFPYLKLHPLGAVVLLVALAAALHAWFNPNLPRIPLKDGRELRILQVKLTSGDGRDHALGLSPEWRWRLWRTLPLRINNLLPRPKIGLAGVMLKNPTVSIWCMAFDPATRTGRTASFTKVVMRDDSGRTYRCLNPHQTGYSEEPFNVTELYFDATPTDSRNLRIQVVIEREENWEELQSVEFTIPNPAYHRLIP